MERSFYPVVGRYKVAAFFFLMSKKPCDLGSGSWSCMVIQIVIVLFILHTIKITGITEEAALCSWFLNLKAVFPDAARIDESFLFLDARRLLHF